MSAALQNVFQGGSINLSSSLYPYAGCTGSKNPVQDSLKIQFAELYFFKLISQKNQVQMGDWIET